jgi:hypothetical protein
LDAGQPPALRRASGSWRGCARHKSRRNATVTPTTAATAKELSPTRPSSRVFGFRSNSPTLLVRHNPGQPGVALRQPRAQGRGATAPAADRRRRDLRVAGYGPGTPSHRLDGTIQYTPPTLLRHWYLYGTNDKRTWIGAVLMGGRKSELIINPLDVLQ